MSIIKWKAPTDKPLSPPWVRTNVGPRKLYLAFGSNLSIRNMQARCPDASPVRWQTGKRKGQPKFHLLDNARLVFRGVADLDWCPGQQAPVGLWWISARDEAELDRIEGYPAHYQKFHIWLDPNKKDQQGLIYLMTDREGIHPPSAYYASTVADGYKNFKINRNYLDTAIGHSFDEKNPSEQTRARRARQRKHSQHARLVPLPESVAIARMEIERDKAEAEHAAQVRVLA